MASTNPANIISYDIADFNFVRREKVHPGYFSGYKKFFRGTKWHVFLAPANDLGRALANAKSRDVNSGLWDIPGVYEFAVAKSPSADRYKTYVGTTKSVRDRHGSYLRDGDHIANFLEAAVKGGLFVMRRIRYILLTRSSWQRWWPSRPRLASWGNITTLGIRAKTETWP